MIPDTEWRLRHALHDLAASQPFEPDPVAIGRRARQAHRRSRVARGVAGAGTAALVAAGVAAVVTGPAGAARPTAVHTATGVTHLAPTVRPDPLDELSGILLASQSRPVGDATLEIQTEKLRGQTYRSYNVYTDSGRYYWSSTPAGIIALAGGQSPGGQMAQEIAESTRETDAFVAAAMKAATGSLAAAEAAMEGAGLPPGSTAPKPDQMQQKALGTTASGMAENYIWAKSQLALLAGGGNPTVRAGALRLISALPDVSVARTTTDGQPTLTITATAAAAGAPGDESTHEQLVIGASTGIPVSAAGGSAGDPADSYTTTYQVSRVTVADVAAGKL